ncbi:hypothetical protein SAICODRAFT_26900 [Saitoella complicata NRRL Y-17804]|nr:uncharacterized protein SAICODRAFT_26900 [Saitoella complicata NRRL Y-17804]ODQ51136.1 hypothetical protein SAICODRAFT_26900 [Saitoella complicata NRRL Y-17804]
MDQSHHAQGSAASRRERRAIVSQARRGQTQPDRDDGEYGGYDSDTSTDSLDRERLDPDVPPIEWCECTSCPGEYFLTPDSITTHLSSSLHLSNTALIARGLPPTPRSRPEEEIPDNMPELQQCAACPFWLGRKDDVGEHLESEGHRKRVEVWSGMGEAERERVFHCREAFVARANLFLDFVERQKKINRRAEREAIREREARERRRRTTPPKEPEEPDADAARAAEERALKKKAKKEEKNEKRRARKEAKQARQNGDIQTVQSTVQVEEAMEIDDAAITAMFFEEEVQEAAAYVAEEPEDEADMAYSPPPPQPLELSERTIEMAYSPPPPRPLVKLSERTLEKRVEEFDEEAIDLALYGPDDGDVQMGEVTDVRKPVSNGTPEAAVNGTGVIKPASPGDEEDDDRYSPPPPDMPIYDAHVARLEEAMQRRLQALDSPEHAKPDPTDLDDEKPPAGPPDFLAAVGMPPPLIQCKILPKKSKAERRREKALRNAERLAGASLSLEDIYGEIADVALSPGLGPESPLSPMGSRKRTGEEAGFPQTPKPAGPGSDGSKMTRRSVVGYESKSGSKSDVYNPSRRPVPITSKEWKPAPTGGSSQQRIVSVSRHAVQASTPNQRAANTAGERERATPKRTLVSVPVAKKSVNAQNSLDLSRQFFNPQESLRQVLQNSILSMQSLRTTLRMPEKLELVKRMEVELGLIGDAELMAMLKGEVPEQTLALANELFPEDAVGKNDGEMTPLTPTVPISMGRMTLQDAVMSEAVQAVAADDAVVANEAPQNVTSDMNQPAPGVEVEEKQMQDVVANSAAAPVAEEKVTRDSDSDSDVPMSLRWSKRRAASGPVTKQVREEASKSPTANRDVVLSVQNAAVFPPKLQESSLGGTVKKTPEIQGCKPLAALVDYLSAQGMHGNSKAIKSLKDLAKAVMDPTQAKLMPQSMPELCSRVDVLLQVQLDILADKAKRNKSFSQRDHQVLSTFMNDWSRGRWLQALGFTPQDSILGSPAIEASDSSSATLSAGRPDEIPLQSPSPSIAYKVDDAPVPSTASTLGPPASRQECVETEVTVKTSPALTPDISESLLVEHSAEELVDFTEKLGLVLEYFRSEHITRNSFRGLRDLEHLANGKFTTLSALSSRVDELLQSQLEVLDKATADAVEADAVNEAADRGAAETLDETVPHSDADVVMNDTDDKLIDDNERFAVVEDVAMEEAELSGDANHVFQVPQNDPQSTRMKGEVDRKENERTLHFCRKAGPIARPGVAGDEIESGEGVENGKGSDDEEGGSDDGEATDSSEEESEDEGLKGGGKRRRNINDKRMLKKKARRKASRFEKQEQKKRSLMESEGLLLDGMAGENNEEPVDAAPEDMVAPVDSAEVTVTVEHAEFAPHVEMAYYEQQESMRLVQEALATPPNLSLIPKPSLRRRSRLMPRGSLAQLESPLSFPLQELIYHLMTSGLSMFALRTLRDLRAAYAPRNVIKRLIAAGDADSLATIDEATFQEAMIEMDEDADEEVFVPPATVEDLVSVVDLLLRGELAEVVQRDPVLLVSSLGNDEYKANDLELLKAWEYEMSQGRWIGLMQLEEFV